MPHICGVPSGLCEHEPEHLGARVNINPIQSVNNFRPVVREGETAVYERPSENEQQPASESQPPQWGAAWGGDCPSAGAPGPYQTRYMPQPPSKPKHRVRNGGIGCLGLVVLLIVIGAAVGSNSSGSGKDASAGSATAIATTTHAAAPAAVGGSSTAPSTRAATSAPVTSAPAAPSTHVVLKVSGSGIKNTKTFTTGGDWSISYSFNCASFGSKGNFVITVYDSDELADLPVNELAEKGSDVTYEHGDSGSHYLQINSECSWKVTVTDGDDGQ